MCRCRVRVCASLLELLVLGRSPPFPVPYPSAKCKGRQQGSADCGGCAVGTGGNDTPPSSSRKQQAGRPMSNVSSAIAHKICMGCWVLGAKPMKPSSASSEGRSQCEFEFEGAAKARARDLLFFVCQSDEWLPAPCPMQHWRSGATSAKREQQDECGAPTCTGHERMHGSATIDGVRAQGP